MIPTLLLAAALAATAPAGQAPATPIPSDRRQVDRVAAIVNGDVITLSELIERAGAEYWRAVDMPAGPARDQARLKALRTAYDAVLTERLVEGEVKNLGIEVTETQLDAAIDDVKKRNNLTDANFNQALAAEGLSVASYRARLRKDFENHLLISAKVQNRVKVSDDDVKAYYASHRSEFAGDDQVKLRLILLQVKTGASADEEARVKATGETLLARLAAGEDFADLARQVSQGPGASSGGDLGWVKKGTMPIDLERVAFVLKPGESSGLVRAKAGWIILKADDRRVANAPSVDDVKDRIREKLSAQQADVYRKQYIDELKREAIIELKIPELAPASAG
jgi:peptidyl-prolyl cis-trans isomerase SurA